MKEKLQVALLMACFLIAVLAYQNNDAIAVPPQSWRADDSNLRDNSSTYAFDQSTAATHDLVSATSGVQLLVTGVFLQAEGNVDVTIVEVDSDDTETDVTGDIELVDGGYLFLDLSSSTIRLTRGSGLSVKLGGAVQVNGWLTVAER